MFGSGRIVDHATSSDLPDLGARTRDNHVEINDEMIAADRRYIAAASVAELTNTAELVPRQETFALSSNGTWGSGQSTLVPVGHWYVREVS